MKCAEVLHLIQRGLDNDLSPTEEESLRTHVAGCSTCQKASEQLNGLHHKLATLPQVNPPYSIVDAMLADLDSLEEREDLGEMKEKATVVKPNQRQRVKKRFWIPGLAMVAGLFIALIVLNERDLAPEQASLSSGEPELAMHDMQMENVPANEATVEDRANRLAEPEEELNFMAIPTEKELPEEMETSTIGSDEDSRLDPDEGMMPDNELENEDEPKLSLTGFTVDEEVKYTSADGVYTAYLGLHHEEIFIDKEEEAYYISKNSWKAPWVVEEITWINNQQLYYVLHHPELEEYQYWLIDVEERTEEQLEEALSN